MSKKSKKGLPTTVTISSLSFSSSSLPLLLMNVYCLRISIAIVNISHLFLAHGAHTAALYHQKILYFWKLKNSKQSILRNTKYVHITHKNTDGKMLGIQTHWRIKTYVRIVVDSKKTKNLKY